MDDTAQLVAMLAHAYGAQRAFANTPLPAAKNASLARICTPQRNTFENLLSAARNVGHELASVLASKAALEQVLDQLPYGLIVVTADLKVLSVNRRASELVAGSRGLTIVKRRLVCMDGRSHQKLERAIQRLQNKTAAVATNCAMRVTRGSEIADLQLHIAGCGVLLTLPGAPEIPAYCIWVFDPGASRTIDRELLREMHGLTTCEARVTAALFRGLSLDDVAGELSVTVNTIKTHLKHVFQKCEVRSQAELLQMLALGPRGQ